MCSVRAIQRVLPASTCALAIVVLSQMTVLPSSYAREPQPATTPGAQPTPTPAPKPSDPTIAAQKIRLYYLREATKIVAVLKDFAAAEGSNLKGLVAKNATEDEIILYGSREERDLAWRIIAALDLPRPGISMEMWGIQISSNKPKQMEAVMPAVRAQIVSTQDAVHKAYAKLQELTLAEIRENDLNAHFRDVLVDKLGYSSALETDRPLSLTDLLLRMIATDKAGSHMEHIANRFREWFRNEPGFLLPSPCSGSGNRKNRAGLNTASAQDAPLARFFKVRGLVLNQQWTADPRADETAEQARDLVVDFGYEYGRLVHRPQTFSPYYLQQSAEALNTRLQAATDSLNSDTQDLFVTPTLLQIGAIVRCYDDVEYAQVGKVSVASLSGVPTVVTSHSVNVYDITPPLKLSDLLDKAKKISDSVTPFDPAKNTVGALQLSQVIGLIGAFGEQEAVYRQMQAGVSVTVTPTVLRNMTSAELKIDLKTGDPQMSGTQEKDVRPISRVSEHNVNTSIYVNALDFFDLSAFMSQATLGGGRGMVPVIGPIWRGLFGEIPIAGKLFSWKKSPKTVYSDSLVLTNSFITPTAMGIALLYPTRLPDICERRLNENDTEQDREEKLEKCFRVDQSTVIDRFKARNSRQTRPRKY